jgi:hypothetical protein
MRSRCVRVIALGMLVAIPGLLLCSGCGSDNPSGPETIVHDLYIGGSYYYFPGGSPTGVTNGAAVFVRRDNHTGPVVSGLTVTVNGYQLQFQQSVGFYSGVVPSLVSGQDVTVSVSDGLGTVSQTVQVPYAPSNLRLFTGAWDISSSSASNRLMWDNPIMVGQGLLCYVYDYDGTHAQLLYYASTSVSTANSHLIFNYELTYYAAMSSALCLVCQGNYATYTSNPDNSSVIVLTGVWGDWPVATQRADDLCTSDHIDAAGPGTSGVTWTRGIGEPN